MARWQLGPPLRLRRGGIALVAAAALAPLVFTATSSEAEASAGYTASFVPAEAGANSVAAQTTSVAVDAVTDTVYVAEPVAHEVSVIDGATGTLTSSISLSGDPAAVAVDPATDVLYVSVDTDGSYAIDIIDGATDTVTRTIPVVGTDLAVDSATDTVAATYPTADEVTLVNAATDAVIATVNTGADSYPRAVAFDQSSGIAWVAGEDGTLFGISETSDSVADTLSIGSGELLSVAVNPSTGLVYAGYSASAGDEVAVVDGATESLVTTIPTGAVTGLAVDPADDVVYATGDGGNLEGAVQLGTTWVIDGSSNTVADDLPRGGVGAAFDSATGAAYEGNFRLDGAWVITPATANALSPVITTAASTSFSTGTAGSFSVQASAQPAATFSESGSLPAGVTLNPDGTLAGTPAAGSGGLYPISITASNGVAPAYTASFSLAVDEAPTVTVPSSATFQVGSAATLPFQVTGYPAPELLNIVGQLPAGMSVVHSATAGWELSGTPAVGSGGVDQVQLEFDNSSGSAESSKITLTVNEAPSFYGNASGTLTAGEPSAVSVQAYSYPSATFSENGKLPAGVTFTAAGVFTGTPSSHIGTYPVTITASNDLGSATESFILYVGHPPAFTSAAHTSFSVGRHHRFVFRTTGFPAPSLSKTGRLPAGIHFRAASNGTAVLAGVPAASDKHRRYRIVVTATNAIGSATVYFILRIT